MWDFKLFIFNFQTEIWNLILHIFYKILNFLLIYDFLGLSISYNKYNFVINTSFIFGIKFLLVIAFLILIRGGTPRYRYDYLTKLGWLKFIGLLILSFFFSVITFYIY